MYFRVKQSFKRMLGEETPKVDPTPNWTYQIQDLINICETKDWNKLLQAVTDLINNPELLKSAPTLPGSLRFIQTNLVDMLAGSKADSSPLIKSTLGIALNIARKEATATIPDRIRNEEILSNRIDNMLDSIRDFKNSNQGFIALWNKVTGKEKDLFLPIQEEQDSIAADIKTTPLTDEGRERLIIQYNRAVKNVAETWGLITGSTAIFLGYVLLQILKQHSMTAAAAGIKWGYAKATAKKRRPKKPKRLK